MTKKKENTKNQWTPVNTTADKLRELVKSFAEVNEKLRKAQTKDIDNKIEQLISANILILDTLKDLFSRLDNLERRIKDIEDKTID